VTNLYHMQIYKKEVLCMKYVWVFLSLVSCFVIMSCAPMTSRIDTAIQACYDNGGVPIVTDKGMINCKCMKCLPVPSNLKIEELEEK
jgi:hypothetical protein